MSTFISSRTDCWAHPDTAPGAPASGPAGVEFSQKRAGSEIGAPLLPSESEAVRGCAPACWARPDTRAIFSPSPPPALREGEGRGEANVYKLEPLTPSPLPVWTGRGSYFRSVRVSKCARRLVLNPGIRRFRQLRHHGPVTIDAIFQDGRAALLRLSQNCSSGRESALISYEIPRIVSRLTSAATMRGCFETASAARPSYPAAQLR